MHLLVKRRVRHERRGSALVQVAVMSTVLMGMSAFVIDVGSMYVAQAELQAMADAAALAAAGQMSGEAGSTLDDARDAAGASVAENAANGFRGELNPTGDVEFGRATYNASKKTYEFGPGGPTYDAVRVTTRRAGQGSLAMNFATIFGISEVQLNAQATATLTPRDMVLVVDLSGSMVYDSVLKRNRVIAEDGFCSNLFELWAASDGPEPSRPFVPGCPSADYDGDTGLTLGDMSIFGSELTASYDPTADEGLVYIPRNSAVSGTTRSTLDTALAARGYASGERLALLDGPEDGNKESYRNRVKVLMNWAEWASGHSGGKFDGDETYGSTGNGNNYVGNNEIIETVDLPNDSFGDLTWNEWINKHINDSSPTSSDTDKNDYRYRYGLKTFVDFLHSERPGIDETPILWQTPQQPLRAIKDSVLTLADELIRLETPDQMGLVVFADFAHKEMPLTPDLATVPNRLYQMQVAHYENSDMHGSSTNRYRMTNIGDGLRLARDTLKHSPYKRDIAKKVIVLMSDGAPTAASEGYGNAEYAEYQAEQIAKDGQMLYVISVGYGINSGTKAWMADLAAKGNGKDAYAGGDPEQYTEELKQIFRSLGGKRPVMLIE